MAVTPAGDDGTLNGTTEVTLVAAPGAAVQRMVKTVTISNTDTAVVTVTLRKVSAGGTRQLCQTDLDPDDTLIWNDPIVLDDVNSSIRAVMSAVPATTQPDWHSSFADLA